MSDLFGTPLSEARLKEPWAHQERALCLLREGIRAGRRKQILVLPTGGGKTMTAMHLIYATLLKGRRATFVCDRNALINQTSATADSCGLDHGVIQADHPRRHPELPFQVASVQTISKRGYWPRSDVFIIDECHAVYGTVEELLGNTDSVVIGLTATPCTAGLGKLYDHVVNGATMSELTNLGVLVPLNIQTCVTPDMAGAKTVGGEWTAKAAGERELKIVGDVLGEWQKYGQNRKTIAFGPDIAYCTELAQRFNAAGIGAATFTAETPDEERKALLSEFSNAEPTLRVLISVDALAKGFDQPDVGCVIDARPLRKSLSTAIQMWGRGLRASKSTGKTDCILLDFSGNIRRFYDDFTDVYFNGFGSLSEAEKQDARPREEIEFTPSGCPQCKHKPFRRKCLACGFEKQTQAEVCEQTGVMQPIYIGKKQVAASDEDLWNQLCTYAKTNLATDRKAGWVWYKYQDFTGKKPPPSFSFDNAPIVAVSPGTVSKLKSLRIAYSKGRQNAVA